MIYEWNVQTFKLMRHVAATFGRPANSHLQDLKASSIEPLSVTAEVSGPPASCTKIHHFDASSASNRVFLACAGTWPHPSDLGVYSFGLKKTTLVDPPIFVSLRISMFDHPGLRCRSRHPPAWMYCMPCPVISTALR